MKSKIALVISFLALLVSMGAPSTWLLKCEVLTVAVFALVYGFTAFSPRLPGWMRCQEMRGVTLVALGCAAMFVPAQFIVCSLLVGVGARLVMTADWGNPPTERTTFAEARVAVPGGSRDIVVRRSGEIDKRDDQS